MNATLRPATHADLAQITAIYAHHVLHGLASFEIDPSGVAKMRKRFNAITAGSFHCFVTQIDSRVLDCTYAAPYRGRSAHRYCF